MMIENDQLTLLWDELQGYLEFSIFLRSTFTVFTRLVLNNDMNRCSMERDDDVKPCMPGVCLRAAC